MERVLVYNLDNNLFVNLVHKSAKYILSKKLSLIFILQSRKHWIICGRYCAISVQLLPVRRTAKVFKKENFMSATVFTVYIYRSVTDNG